MKRLQFTIFGIVLFLWLVGSQSVLALNYESYIVKSGDTLWGISSTYKVDINELKKVNNLEGELLHIGQELKIPKHTYKGSHYVVEKGDKLWTIAKKFNVDIEELQAENNSLDTHILQIGQIIRIPQATKASSADEMDNQDKLDKLELESKEQTENHELNEENIYYHLIYGVDSSYLKRKMQLASDLIEQKMAAAQKAKVKAASLAENEEDSQNSREKLTYTKEDLKWLATIIEAEAEDQPYKGKLAVGSVVINRMLHKSFPNTIKDVVFQKTKRVYQFSPVGDGRIYRVKPSEDSYKAAKAAFDGEDPTNGALFFYNPKIAKSKWITTRKLAIVIADHRFAY